MYISRGGPGELGWTPHAVPGLPAPSAAMGVSVLSPTFCSLPCVPRSEGSRRGWSQLGPQDGYPAMLGQDGVLSSCTRPTQHPHLQGSRFCHKKWGGGTGMGERPNSFKTFNSFQNTARPTACSQGIKPICCFLPHPHIANSRLTLEQFFILSSHLENVKDYTFLDSTGK